MMKLLLLFWLVALVSANPFAPKQSKNTAEAEFVARLLRKGTPLRSPAAKNQPNNTAKAANVDLTSYSVVFQKCQFIRTTTNTINNGESGAAVPVVKRFVNFRLCKSGNDCTSCKTNYGEYVIDLYDYLQATVTYQKAVQTNNCTTCETDCTAFTTDDATAANQAQADDGQINGGRFLSSSSSSSLQKLCKSCLDECSFIKYLGSNGYYDATDFITCTKVYDDGTTVFYAGPVCANSGSRIKIGIFTDDYCYNLDSSKDPDDYVKNGNTAVKLTYHLLKQTYKKACISCASSKNGIEKTNPFCQYLYANSTCETCDVKGKDVISKGRKGGKGSKAKKQGFKK